MTHKTSPMVGTSPLATFALDVDATHTLHVEEWGRHTGLPAVFLHGGPGGCCQPAHRALFDPDIFRLILFDQRGCGLSRPRRCLTDNTTGHLIADMEAIRTHLDIPRWLVVGGSWGSTLALAYAQAHPQRVLGLALRAVFLGSREEADWAFRRAAQTYAPELWQCFRDLLPEDERADPVAAYSSRMRSDNPDIHTGAAWVWHDYERALSSLTPPSYSLPESLEAAARKEDTPNSPYLETWYMAHDFFLEPGVLLKNAPRLGGIPGVIVQSRYDLLCPPRTAHRLCAAWPEAELHMVAQAGHAMSEPGVRAAFTRAIKNLAITG